MHVRKHVTSSMHAGLLKQPNTWLQHCCAMQFPHGEPSEGQVVGPQKPWMQAPEQQSAPGPQAEPAGRHWSWQMPPAQLPLQHWTEDWHMPPGGVQGAAHTPP